MKVPEKLLTTAKSDILSDRDRAFCEPPVLRLQNGISVVPEGILHSPEFFDVNRQRITQLITNANFVVSEASPGFGFTNTNVFFMNLLDTAWQEKKPVLIVDPESDTQEFLRSLSFNAGLIATAILVGRDIEKKRFGRRTILKAIASLALGAPGFDKFLEVDLGKGESIEGSCIHDNPIDTPISYVNFRNAGGALGLRTAAEGKMVSGQGVLFIGKGHLDGYRTLLADPARARDVYHSKIDITWSPTPVQVWKPGPGRNEWALVKELQRR